MKFYSTGIPGCMKINLPIYKDQRGVLIKTFHEDMYMKEDLAIDIKEQYYSFSYKGVLRGLHFQTPPMDHKKLVFCTLGRIIDVVVDVRVGSPTYGQYFMCELSPLKGNALFIPSGLAHGFYTLSDYAIVVNNASSPYSLDHDSGILWNSLNIPWPNQSPILSAKDQNLTPFQQFSSPFSYEG